MRQFRPFRSCGWYGSGPAVRASGQGQRSGPEAAGQRRQARGGRARGGRARGGRPEAAGPEAAGGRKSGWLYVARVHSCGSAMIQPLGNPPANLL